MKPILAAGRYMRGNRKRIFVLIISLALFFTMSYLTDYAMSSTVETFRSMSCENMKYMQYSTLKPAVYGIDGSGYGPGDAEQTRFKQEFRAQEELLAQKLREDPRIEDAFPAEVIFPLMRGTVGNFSLDTLCVQPDKVPVIMSHFGAVLKEGRMPEQPGEIILDTKAVQNTGYKLGDSVVTSDFKLVGIAECDLYFGCGVASGNGYRESIAALSDGSVTNFGDVLTGLGYTIPKADAPSNSGYSTDYATIVDYESGCYNLQKEVINSISTSSDLISRAILLVLTICLVAVFSMYLRDRHEEWCLYQSLGFSRSGIYLSITAELLLTNLLALLAGAVLSAVGILCMRTFLLEPLGLIGQVWRGKACAESLLSMFFIFAVLQIPVQAALHRIRTVDAIEEDTF